MPTPPTSPSRDDADPAQTAGSSAAANTGAEGAPIVPPMTASLMGRLFLVPAVLVSMMVIGLVIVVGLFGWSAIGQRPTVSQLLTTLESNPGDKHGGALFPESKEVWLAAQELANRLRDPSKELTPPEIVTASERLEKIYSATAERMTGETKLSDGERQKAVFTLLALARLGTPASVRVIQEAATAFDPDFRKAAIRGAVEFGSRADAAALVPAIRGLLNDSGSDVRLMACAALGQIARPGDRESIEALAARLRDDREVQWNAALALARLGSSRGKMTLLSMLDRKYWEQGQVEYASGGTEVRHPFTPRQIEEYLSAAVDAAARLKDADLDRMIDALARDPSVVVRDRVSHRARLTTRDDAAKLEPSPGDVATAGRAG